MRFLSVTTFSLQEAAKMTKFPGGEKKFAAWLREEKFLLKNNTPYQKFMDRKWFILTARTIHKANPPFTVGVTRVTCKGLYHLEEIVFNTFHRCLTN